MITLPWPPKQLSPNARTHWANKARITKKYRADCYLLTKAGSLTMPAERAVLWLTFCPPDRRRRDDDNLIAAFKAGRDGLAEALGIDDSALSLLVQIGEPTKGGAVRVALIALPEQQAQEQAA